MIVSFWHTQPFIAVMPDSRCAKDTSIATEHARNTREIPGKYSTPLIKMFLIAFRLSGNPLKCREFLRGLATSSYNFGYVELSNSTHLTLQRELYFCGSLQIDCVSPTSSKA